VVSVIVPVLNEARLAGELAGRLRDLDAVVVDGGSRDDTRAQLERLGVRVIEAPRGRARQMNAGARLAGGGILLFLHADTRLPEHAIESVERAIRRGAVGGCFRLRIDSQDVRLRLAARIITWRSLLRPSASGDQAIFVSRDAFERIGGYREIDLCEDLDLVERLSRLGRFVCVDGYASTSARRWETHGIGRTIALMWALRLGWHLGVPPATLGRLYGPDVR
jgi:rSAM/selenodomain-associated transferase 2